MSENVADLHVEIPTEIQCFLLDAWAYQNLSTESRTFIEEAFLSAGLDYPPPGPSNEDDWMTVEQTEVSMDDIMLGIGRAVRNQIIQEALDYFLQDSRLEQEIERMSEEAERNSDKILAALDKEHKEQIATVDEILEEVKNEGNDSDNA